ncbi:lysine transporter LysE [Streptomyces sp. NPDC005820]|uniref:lysine transporter LysE n=1 Tax=Streptomyces sp. NPDC005820 TaxID=3157069 RepID=UPI0033D93503
MRVIRGIGSFVKELLEEFVGEAALTLLVCLTLAGPALAFVWGWQRSPLAAEGVGGALLAFLCYGAWELSRPPREGRRRRLAGAAATTFAVAALFLTYAASCTC